MKFGWLKDPEDNRDKLFESHFNMAIAHPPKIDYRSLMSPVEDQGQLGSCTANALVSGAEMLYLKRNKVFNGSRLWLYYKERERIKSVSEDSGANIRDGIKVMAKQGLPQEKLWPYAIKKFAEKPSQDADTDAAQRLIANYYRVLDNEQMKAALAHGFTVTFGINVYESFYNVNHGYIPTPEKGEKVEGGHAMQVVGYNDAQKMFIVRNSWGKTWGVDGYCYISYKYMEQADDRWVYEVIS